MSCRHGRLGGWGGPKVGPSVKAPAAQPSGLSLSCPLEGVWEHGRQGLPMGRRTLVEVWLLVSLLLPPPTPHPSSPSLNL